MGQSSSQHSIGTLRGGTTVASYHIPTTRTITVYCLVKVGSRHEIPGLYGASHHLEHMLFKGTSAYPSSKALTLVLDRIGAVYNAHTSNDHTAYYITVPCEHAETAFTLISEMVRFPLLRGSELDRERWVVAEEIHRKHDNPSANVFTLALEQVFAKNSLGRSVAGEVDDVKQHRIDAVRHFWAQHYVPSNTALVVCGDLPGAAGRGDFAREVRRLGEYYMEGAGAPLRSARARRLRRYVARRAERLRQRPPLASELSPFRPTQKAPCLRCEQRETDQCHTVLAYRTPFGADDPRRCRAADLVCDMLAGYMSARLWEVIRERNGWAYSVSMHFEEYAETGVICVHMGLKTHGPSGQEDPSITREAILTALREIETFEPSGAELDIARGNRRGKLSMRAESTSWLAQFYASQLLHRPAAEALSVDEEREAVARVGLDEVRSLAHGVLRRPELCTLCCITRTPHTRDALAAVAAEKGLRCRLLSERWRERHTERRPPAGPASPP